MKKLILLAVAAMLITSCEDNKNQVLDPLAKLAINAPEGSKTTTNPDYKTPREVIELATTMILENRKFAPNDDYFIGSISDHHKDFENMRILMDGVDVIKDNTLNLIVIECKDFVLAQFVESIPGEGVVYDTLAYVPNIQLRTAEPLIKAAYEAGEYDQMYELFQNSLTFIPINGKDFAKLKAEGKN